MHAEIIAVGSELLTPAKVDTNSLYLARKLAERGIQLIRKSVVGDDRRRLAEEIRRARRTVELVLLSGGLGPTLDDLTREAAADATSRPLVLHESIVRDIAARFRSFNRPMAEVNKRQAYVLEGAEILANARGTAPGQWLEDDCGILVLLPGPPRELEPLFEQACLPRLDRRAPGGHFFTHTLRIAGMGESDVEQRISRIYARENRVDTTILSSPGDIQVHLVARAEEAGLARTVAEGLGAELQQALGAAVYSLDGASLDTTVARLLRQRDWSLAVAESCTGGLLAGRLTEVPGSSEFFAGGIVSYSEAAKDQWLGVPAETLQAHGAVSEATAAAMAAAAQHRASETLGEPSAGVSTTGYAGPSGGTESDPVGTVYIGVASPVGIRIHRRRFGGGRRRVRTLAVQAALDMLRRDLLSASKPAS